MDLAFIRALNEASRRKLQHFCIIKKKGKVLLYSDHNKTFSNTESLLKNNFYTGYTTYEGIHSWDSWNNIQTFNNADNCTDWWAKKRGLQNNSALEKIMPSDKWNSSLSNTEFIETVKLMQQEMGKGKYYLANLTKIITRDNVNDPIFLALISCLYHPCDNRFFLHTEFESFLGLSPEKFISIKDRRVTTEPMKGTAINQADLENNEKELEENVMMADLVRADMSKICDPDSMHVIEQNKFTKHPGIVQMSSVIQGDLNIEHDIFNFLNEILPVASVTGTPKPYVVRRLQELEPHERNIYCGVYGWIDTEDNECDLSVAIRIIRVLNSQVSIGVGAGITYRSDPEKELEETELKAHNLKKIVDSQIKRYSDFVFTSLAFSNNKLFLPKQHAERLSKHASEAFSLDIPSIKILEALQNFLKDLEEKNHHYVKIIIDSSGRMQFEYCSYIPDKADLILGIGFYSPQIDNSYMIKSSNRSDYELALEIAKDLTDASIDDCLLLSNGEILETTRANIFIRKNNIISTPKISRQNLQGILRDKLLNTIKQSTQYSLVEKDIYIEDLMEAEEIITTNSVRGPQSVGCISSRLIEREIDLSSIGNNNDLLSLATNIFNGSFETLNVS